MNQKKNNKEQQQQKIHWENTHQTQQQLPSMSRKWGKNYHLLPSTRLSSLNHLQARITSKFKRKSSTLFCPPASAQPSGGLSHAPKQNRSLCQTKVPPGFEPRVSGGKYPSGDNENCTPSEQGLYLHLISTFRAGAHMG